MWGLFFLLPKAAIGGPSVVLQRAERIDSLQSWELMESILREKWHSYECGAREFHRSCQPALSSQWGVSKVRSIQLHLGRSVPHSSWGFSVEWVPALPQSLRNAGSSENCSFLEALPCIFGA